MLNIIVGGVSSFASRVVYEAEKYPDINILTSAVDPKTLIDNIERYIGGCDAVLLGFPEDTNAALLEVLVRYSRNFIPFIAVSDVYRDGRKWSAYCAYAIPQGQELGAVLEFFKHRPEGLAPDESRGPQFEAGHADGVLRAFEKKAGLWHKEVVGIPRRTACFVSCRGGAGTTLVALHAARRTAEHFRVVVVDLDTRLPWGTACRYLGHTGQDKLAISASLAGWRHFPFEHRALESAVMNHVHRVSKNLFLLSPGTSTAEMKYISPDLVDETLDVLSRHFDLTVVDVGSVIDEISLAAFMRADEIFVVSGADEVDVDCLADYAAGVFPYGAVPRGKLSLVVNRTLNPARAGVVARAVGIPLACALPEVQAWKGDPLKKAPEASREIDKIAARLFPSFDWGAGPFPSSAGFSILSKLAQAMKNLRRKGA